jgi:hypothetical protein
MLLLRLLMLLVAGYAVLLAFARLAVLEDRVESLSESHELVLQKLLRSDAPARAVRASSCESAPLPVTEGPREEIPRGASPGSLDEDEDETCES